MGDHGLCLTTLMGVAVGSRDGCQGNGGIVLGCSDGETLHWHTPLCTQSMHVVLNGPVNGTPYSRTKPLAARGALLNIK